VRGKSTSLQDIQDAFQKAPYDLSEGTVINYLTELVDSRKLSTWKQKNRRFYGPPKLPLPLKFGLTMTAIILVIGFIIDTFMPRSYIYEYVYLHFSQDVEEIPQATMLPLVIYCLIVTIIFTCIWYLSQRKLFK